MYKKIIITDAVLALVLILAFCLIKPPEAVHGLTVQDVTYNEVQLSWDEAEGSKGYHIYRSTDGEKFEYLDSTSETNFSDANLDTGTTYTYKVKSHNGIKKAKGDDVEATPVLDTPIIKGDIKSGKVKLSLKSVDGAQEYKVYRNNKAIDTVPAKAEEKVEYIDSNADVDTDYIYKVSAVRDTSESEESNEIELTLVSPGKITAETDCNAVNLTWDSDYTSYKLYKDDDLITETSENTYSIDATEGTYKFKLVGTKDDITSPEIEQEFKVSEVPMDNQGAINAAVDWAVNIANDDSFTYGTGKGAHHFGCYFCGTNYGPNKYMKPSSKYKKTYCCNPFISAAYAHGAGDPALLKACKTGHGIGMSEKSFTRYGNWKNVGKPSYSNLHKGDVLVKSSHVAMYIGNGKYVQAGPEGWGAKSIAVSNLSSKMYNSFKFVMRYTGTGSGTMYSVEEITG